MSQCWLKYSNKSLCSLLFFVFVFYADNSVVAEFNFSIFSEKKQLEEKEIDEPSEAKKPEGAIGNSEDLKPKSNPTASTTKPKETTQQKILQPLQPKIKSPEILGTKGKKQQTQTLTVSSGKNTNKPIKVTMGGGIKQQNKNSSNSTKKPRSIKSHTSNIIKKGSSSNKVLQKSTTPSVLRVGFLKTNANNYALADFICNIAKSTFAMDGLARCVLQPFNTNRLLLESLIDNQIELGITDDIEIQKTIYYESKQKKLIARLRSVRSITALYGNTVTLITRVKNTQSVQSVINSSKKIGVMHNDTKARFVLESIARISLSNSGTISIYDFFNEHDAIRALRTKRVDSFFVYSGQPSHFVAQLAEYGRGQIVDFDQSLIKQIMDLNPCQNFTIKKSLYHKSSQGEKLLTPLYITELIGSKNLEYEFVKKLAKAITEEIEDIYDFNKNIIIPNKNSLRACNTFKQHLQPHHAEINPEEEQKQKKPIKTNTPTKREGGVPKKSLNKGK